MSTLGIVLLAWVVTVGFLGWFQLYFRPARQDLHVTRVIEACEAVGLHHPRANPGSRKASCENCHTVETRWHRI